VAVIVTANIALVAEPADYAHTALGVLAAVLVAALAAHTAAVVADHAAQTSPESVVAARIEEEAAVARTDP
jgi:hypothetical protein